jgi:hypothetical protein
MQATLLTPEPPETSRLAVDRFSHLPCHQRRHLHPGSLPVHCPPLVRCLYTPANPQLNHRRAVSSTPASSAVADVSEPPATAVLQPVSYLTMYSPVRYLSVLTGTEDAESLPTTTPPAKTYGPRDLSGLRSNQFRNLQRRVRRHHTIR